MAVIGAGIAGLSAALDLSVAGFQVTVFERAASPGGKMRELTVDGRPMDAGPTVFTLRAIFDELFAAAGTNLDAHLRLTPATVLARHAWDANGKLDLFAEVRRSAEAIGEFAGRREADGFLRFTAQAKRIYQALEHSFIRAPRPSPFGLVRRAGLGGLADLWNIQPFSTLYRSMGGYFKDARLRQLFGRYATYCGSSPYQAPATLMLIAHVEQAGVWTIDGGMHRLAAALAALSVQKGAVFRYATEVTRVVVADGRTCGVEIDGAQRLEFDAVICNADNGALRAGMFGAEVMKCVPSTGLRARSLSAVTWNLVAQAQGFELAHHSVFFSRDYRAEFDDIFKHRRLPRSPSVYVCAQDRREDRHRGAPGAERLFCLVNAPPIGDVHSFEPAEIDRCEFQTFDLLARCGLIVERRPQATIMTTPADFNRLFPATGGALYGPASHGWMASFKRPGSRTAIPGLYLAGGSTHPGAGVPMAAVSGRLAAACIAADYASIAPYRAVAMPGGTSMH